MKRSPFWSFKLSNFTHQRNPISPLPAIFEKYTSYLWYD